MLRLCQRFPVTTIGWADIRVEVGSMNLACKYFADARLSLWLLEIFACASYQRCSFVGMAVIAG
jgi:hypothetical protein